MSANASSSDRRGRPSALHRQVGWLSDEDAEALLKTAQERNLTVHMYRRAIGEAVASHLADHAVRLRHWLGVLQRRAAAE